MIRQDAAKKETLTEPTAGRPESTGEEWLGQNRSAKRRLWERLNPRNRAHLRLLGEALALGQLRGQLPEESRARLTAALAELERVAARVRALLAEVARRTPPRA